MKTETRLVEVGDGLFAYIQRDGSWGWSNAGFVRDGEQSLLVDTLFDEHLTAQMLRRLSSATGIGPDDINTLVNTHANGDHTFGNHLVKNAEIISSSAGAHEMEEYGPARLAELKRAAPGLGAAGEYFLHCFSDFDFDALSLRTPTRTFTGQCDLAVGDKQVRLIEVGPAHTKGDVLVYVSADKTVFTGDILFINCTPVMWAGPVANWIKACELIEAMDVETVVPGHGPITDKRGVRAVREYLSFIRQECRKAFAAGLSVRDAAHAIALGAYGAWGEAERIAVNVNTLYQEFGAREPPLGMIELFALMNELRKR